MKKIEINLHRPSKDLLNKLVISLIDLLLFSRKQIPFSFDLFRKFIENKKTAIDDKARNWKTEKQLQLASETLESICCLKEVVENEFLAGESSCFMILFGSTVFTPKESYQIKFPSTSETIFPTFINETAEVKKILLRLIQNDDLMTSDKDQLPQTNVFVLFKRSVPIDDHPELNEIRNFKLAKSCKKYSIKFRDSSDFEIFDESFQGLSLTEKSTEPEEEDVEFWYQSKTFVKGFKDILVNNQSIWN